MLENSLETFSENLFLFITKTKRTNQSQLIKKHTENLQKHGEFSFPNIVECWRDYLDFTHESDELNGSLMRFLNKDTSDLVAESSKWPLQILSATEVKKRIHVFLERPSAIKVGLTEALNNNTLLLNRINENTSKVVCNPTCESLNDLTSLRLKYLSRTIQNLYAICKCKDKPTIFMTAKSSSKGPEGSAVVLSGTVLNAKTGVKETTISGEDFIRLRQNEMTLIAQHKYGVRVTTDSKWKQFIDHLGESAVMFELLQIKPSSAVKINFDSSMAGSSKGASFILYNCARLETIIRTYTEQVEEGTYPSLPDFKDTDFSLLTQEDEWCLIFNFIMGLPSLIESCVSISEGTCEFRPHHICSHLCAMVRVFSQYYRKVRILTEPRKHLLPVMFARIHMVKILSDTLKTCLKILNIKSVSQM